MRRVRWFPGENGPVAYLVSVALWLPASVVPMALSPAERPGLFMLSLLLPLAAFYTTYDMLLDAVTAHDRSMLGLWALRAQLWLLFGGAVPQAVRELRGREKKS